MFVNNLPKGVINIKVKVVALGSVVDVELGDGATVADAARDARVEGGLECRFKGRVVSEIEQDSTPVEDGDTLVFTSPSLKHG